MIEQPKAASEMSVADFKAMFSKTEAPKPSEPVAPAATATPEEPKSAEPEATPEAETKTETTEPERDENGRFKAKDAADETETADSDDLPKNVQKRIGKAVAKQREAERKAAELEARLAALEANRDGNPQPETPAISGKPKLEDFDSVEAFTDALTDWKFEQREKAKAEQEAAKTTEEKIQEARKKYPDFDNVAFSSEVISLVNRNKAVGAAITESPIFAKLAMHLGENTEELARIVALPATRAIAELGKLEEKLTSPAPKAPATPKPTAPPLPKPPTQLAATSSADTRPQSEWSAAEWRSYFAARNR